MLDDLSTDSFINGLRCFIAIRGAVRQIRSDQGTNFMGAKNELTQALKQLDVNRLNTFLAEKQCDFVMNTLHASHAGGVWERQIRTVRNVLRSTLSLSSGRLDDASLRTFFYQAMAIVNSRPLTVDNLSDPNSQEPLTPNHLLTMKPITALPPPGKFIREDMYSLASSSVPCSSGAVGENNTSLALPPDNAGILQRETSKSVTSSWRRQICPGMSGSWQKL